jgi:hypothetical protein
MRSCPVCHFSLLALKIAQKIGSDPVTGICERCSNQREQSKEDQRWNSPPYITKQKQER